MPLRCHTQLLTLTPITALQNFTLESWLTTINKVTNTLKIKFIRMFKEHKRAMSIISGVILIAPLLYILEFLDIIAVLEILDVTT
jgi:hypothetical protein